jgi:hypothetical protein
MSRVLQEKSYGTRMDTMTKVECLCWACGAKLMLVSAPLFLSLPGKTVSIEDFGWREPIGRLGLIDWHAEKAEWYSSWDCLASLECQRLNREAHWRNDSCWVESLTFLLEAIHFPQFSQIGLSQLFPTTLQDAFPTPRAVRPGIRAVWLGRGGCCSAHASSCVCKPKISPAGGAPNSRHPCALEQHIKSPSSPAYLASPPEAALDWLWHRVARKRQAQGMPWLFLVV